MLRGVIGIVVAVCVGSTQAIATDKTYFCSALLETSDKKPTPFKFQVKNGELIDFRLWENSYQDPFLKEEDRDKQIQAYKVVEDTEIGLVAVHSETYYSTGYQDKGKAKVWFEVVLINKVLGDFRQIFFTTEKIADDYQGTCSVSNK